MSPDTQQDDGRLPSAESWFAGRPWVAALSALIACANAVLVVVDLTAGDIETTRDGVLVALRVGITISFAVVALSELRTRVVVDAAGVHQQRLVQRRSHRWEEIADIRPPERTWGEPTVELLLRDGESVTLPRSAGHLHVLRAWHAASGGSTEPLPRDDLR